MPQREMIGALKEWLSHQIIGQEKLLDRLLIALLADGHLLVEGAPGLAKTKAIKTLSEGIEGDYHRIQFTPDLLPSDITGTEIYRPEDGSFTFQQGPIFHNLVLADEINRAPAKVQSALLEAMAEHQVSVGRQTFHLPELFLVMATQNPIEQEGTYPLPEAELDRFMLKLRMDYPEQDEELNMVRQVTRSAKADMLEVSPLRTLLQAKDVQALQKIASDLPLDDQVLDYAVRLARATRSWPGLAMGAGPRASIALVRGARARALLRGGDFVLPDDIKGCALAVLRHRVRLAPELDIEGLSVDQVLQQLLDQVPAPRL